MNPDLRSRNPAISIVGGSNHSLKQEQDPRRGKTWRGFFGSEKIFGGDALKKFAFIKNLAIYLPEKIETNEKYDSRFIEKLGINQRHIVSEGESSSDIAIRAAEKIDLSGVDFLLLCTQYPDYNFAGSIETSKINWRARIFTRLLWICLWIITRQKFNRIGTRNSNSIFDKRYHVSNRESSR